MRTKSKLIFGARAPRGETVELEDGKVLRVPARPRVVRITGDGIGSEIWAAADKVWAAAVRKAYGGKRRIVWVPAYAGDEAVSKFGNALPEDTLEAIRRYHIAIKGPLGTPPTGMRSLNVKVRIEFDLDQCIRPVHYMPGVPSPMLRPADLDIVIFRQNTEGPYTGIEFPPGSPEANHIIDTVAPWGHHIPAGSGVGISFASEEASKNLVRKAIQYAIDHGRNIVTIMAKSNNLKYTDGEFLNWGIEVAYEEFGDRIINSDDFWNKYKGVVPAGKILLNSKIADDMFQQILLNPKNYSVIATSNLNGDLLSDSAAATHGGIGQAAGTNKGKHTIVYEPTHGTAPDIAGQNKANPTSLILSGAMMFEDFGWHEAESLVKTALEKTIAAKTVTGDFAKFIDGAKFLSTTEFGDAIIANMAA
jgi:isocitrate dehydrogenase